MMTSTGWVRPSAVTTPSAVIRSIGSLISSTSSRLRVLGQTPLSSSMRLASGGYCGTTWASSSGSSPKVNSRYMVSSWRSSSLRAPTARGSPDQPGSTSAAGRMPSDSRQNSQNRYHWL